MSESIPKDPQSTTSNKLLVCKLTNVFPLDREKYEFEKAGGVNRVGDESLTATDVVSLAYNLKLDLENDLICPPNVKRALMEYVTAVHGNIFWYVNKQKKEIKKYRWYMVLTIALVIAVPAVTLLFPLIVLKSMSTGNNVPTGVVISAQITGLLTGIFGLHRVFSTWLFSRNSAHTFWKASSELKKLLYNFEDQWKSKVVIDNKLAPSFLNALGEARKTAWEIVENEQESFFQSLSNISIDLQDVITRGAAGAKAVVGGIAEPIIKEIVSREQKKSQVRVELDQVRNEVTTLQAKKREIEERIKRYEFRYEIEKDEVRKKEYRKQSSSAQSRLDRVELELAGKKVAYQAKWMAATGKTS